MLKKAYTPEQILNKLREVEILLNQDTSLPVVWRKIISPSRRRKIIQQIRLLVI